MREVKANSKAKHLEQGKTYLVTEEIAKELERKGWVGDEPAHPKRRSRKNSE